jgi:hypothetical protein
MMLKQKLLAVDALPQPVQEQAQQATATASPTEKKSEEKKDTDSQIKKILVCEHQCEPWVHRLCC